jgi:hypothetical protein
MNSQAKELFFAHWFIALIAWVLSWVMVNDSWFFMRDVDRFIGMKWWFFQFIFNSLLLFAIQEENRHDNKTFLHVLHLVVSFLVAWTVVVSAGDAPRLNFGHWAGGIVRSTIFYNTVATTVILGLASLVGNVSYDPDGAREPAPVEDDPVPNNVVNGNFR